MTPYWCPNCDGELEFIGSVGITLHDDGGDVQADRYDCNSGHTVLVFNTVDSIEDEDDAGDSEEAPADPAGGTGSDSSQS